MTLWQLVHLFWHEDVVIRATEKKYRKSVWTSYRQSKGDPWSEAQLKQIDESHQAVLGHNHKIIWKEQNCTVVEDCRSFEIQRMMVSTEQLLNIKEATGWDV